MILWILLLFGSASAQLESIETKKWHCRWGQNNESDNVPSSGSAIATISPTTTFISKAQIGLDPVTEMLIQTPIPEMGYQP